MTQEFRTGLFLISSLSLSAAGDLFFYRHRLPVPADMEIRGAAVIRRHGLNLYAWGTGLWEWRFPSPSVHEIAGNLQAWGGCPVQPNGLLLQEQAPLGRLAIRKPPDWQPRAIDTDVELLDCAPATLLGHKGILVVQRGMQVRFYEPDRQSYREIYSFYTPSRQSGILTSDIDRDGRTDVFCGNYWIRQPKSFGLPWRLFAINTYTEQEDSATFRLALADLDGDGVQDLVASQTEMSPARLAWFKRPSDPRELWEEHRLDGGLGLARLRGLAAADFDGDSSQDIAVGENNGSGSRLLLFQNQGGKRFSVQELSRGDPVLRLFAVDVNGDKRSDLISVGPHSVDWWENQRRR